MPCSRGRRDRDPQPAAPPRRGGGKSALGIPQPYIPMDPVPSMMAVTVERALAFPLRDSWVPCRNGGVKCKEEKRFRGPQPTSPSMRPFTAREANFHVSDPTVDGKTELGRCLQPKHGKTGIANGGQQSQVISQQIFHSVLRGRCSGAGAESRGQGEKAIGKKAVFKGGCGPQREA